MPLPSGGGGASGILAGSKEQPNRDPTRHVKTVEEVKSEWCDAHIAGLLGLKNKKGVTFKCRATPVCSRRHVDNLKSMTRVEATQIFAFIKGFMDTQGDSLVTDAGKGTFKGERLSERPVKQGKLVVS